MQITHHTLIEIAFTVWNTPASHAMIRHRGAEHTNIPRTRHLAYYLLSKRAGLSIAEIADIFSENKHTCKSGYESAALAIETNFITWKNQAMRNKYLEAVKIIDEM
jgi:hypothetical protein